MNNLRLLLLLALPVSLAAQDNPTPQTQTVAETLWDQLQSVRWGAAQPGWQTTHPETTCQQFRSNSSWKTVDEQWSYRCTQHSNTQTVEHFFYALRLKRLLVPRLRQFRVSATGFIARTLQEAHGMLRERLISVYGPSVVPETANDFGSAGWREVLRWETKRLEIYLYWEESPAGPARLGLLARHRKLLDVMAEEELLDSFLRGLPASRERTLDLQLAEQLRYTFVNLPTLMMQTEAERDPEEVRITLAALLRTAGLASARHRSPLLLAAARLAERLPALRPDIHPDSQPRAMPSLRLASYGVTQAANPSGGARAHANSLLWRVWQDDSDSEWGDHAFLLLQARGWDMTAGCANGSDGFRIVIGHGEAFLARRRRSPHRLEVLVALAQAYETWWSLSQASGRDTYVKRARYQEGAVAARKKAVSYYQRVLKLAPKSVAAAYARLRLPRLKLQIDTNQRRFFCLPDAAETLDRSAVIQSGQLIALDRPAAEVFHRR